MSGVSGLVTAGLHAGLTGLAAPVLAGLVRWPDRGEAPTEAWRELAQLWRRAPMLPETASFAFAIAPAACAGFSAAAAMLVPSFALGMATAPVADLLVVAGLLAGAKGVLALAALDAGSAAGGLAAGRLAMGAVPRAPALLLAAMALGLVAGSTNLDAIATTLRDGVAPRMPPLLIGVALAGLLGGATLDAVSRDHAGRHLALLRYADALRLTLGLNLVAAVTLPFGLAPDGAGPVAWLVGLAAWAARIGVLVAAAMAWRLAAARLRPGAAPWLGAPALLAALTVLLLLIRQGIT